MQRLHAYSQAYMSIHIAVVGGGLAGLTTALALTRVGHHVTVFEQHAEDALLPSGGVQIPPNQSKILVRWGLKDALSKIAVTNTALRMYTYSQGEFLGKHVWDKEVMRECGGEWMFTTYEALRLLYIEAARANGAVLRFGTKVEAVDQDGALLQLADGEVFSADLIVGADGAKSLVRNILFEGNEDTQSTGLVSFNTTVPLEILEADPSLQELLEHAMSLWMGEGCHAWGFPLAPCGKYALHFQAVHTTGLPIPDRWGEPPVSSSLFMSSIGNVEHRLHTLATHASLPSAILCQTHEDLEDGSDWVLPSSLGIALGDAAHPALPASTQAAPLVFEDAVAFAKLFSHLRRPEQVPRLLHTFTSLRAARARRVIADDASTFGYFQLTGDAASVRNTGMREAVCAGQSVLGHASTSEQWEQNMATWAYDAEDDADNWWVEWGALEERAQETPRALAFDFSAVIATVDIQANVS